MERTQSKCSSSSESSSNEIRSELSQTSSLATSDAMPPSQSLKTTNEESTIEPENIRKNIQSKMINGQMQTVRRSMQDDDGAAVTSDLLIKCGFDEPVYFISYIKTSIIHQIEEIRLAFELNPAMFRRKQPMGMKNLGNTCWFNSIIQSLFSIPHVRKFFLELSLPLKQIADLHLNDRERASVKFLIKLRKLFMTMQDPSQDLARPIEALDEFRSMSTFERSDFSQEDASEAINHLVDRIEDAIDCLIKHLKDANVVKRLANLKEVFMKCIYGKFQSIRDGVLNGVEVFREVNVPICNSNELYDALFRLWFEFPNELDSCDNAHFERWICDIPDIVFICLSRYRFSSETKQIVKICDQLVFPETLFIDRYLVDNRDRCKWRRVKELQFVKQLNALTKKFDTFNQLQVGQSKLSSVRALVHVNSTIDEARKIVEAAETRDNEFVERIHLARNYIREMIKWFQTRHDEVALEVRQAIAKKQLLYDTSQLRKHPYKLQAICVHRGVSTRGHYWTYVLDQKSNVWYKCNDAEITPVEYSEVRKNSETAISR